jgi:hypothetical protein
MRVSSASLFADSPIAEPINVPINGVPNKPVTPEALWGSKESRLSAIPFDLFL